MKKQNVLYYELKPLLLLIGAFHVFFLDSGLFWEKPLALFAMGTAGYIIYQRLLYRGYLSR